jgi:hypothetical protein
MQLPTLQQVLAQQPVRIAVAVIIAIALLYMIRMAIRMNGFIALVCLVLLSYGAYWILTNALF